MQDSSASSIGEGEHLPLITSLCGEVTNLKGVRSLEMVPTTHLSMEVFCSKTSKILIHYIYEIYLHTTFSHRG